MESGIAMDGALEGAPRGAAAGARGLLDRAAILLSGLCVAHCVASTVAVALLASAGGLLVDPRIHAIGLLLALLLGAVALGAGYRAHRARVPLVLGCVGLALMVVGLVVPHGPAETLITVTGVSILALGHVRNRRAHGG